MSDTNVTFEEKEKYIEQQIIKAREAKNIQANVNLFLEEEGISVEIKARRKEIYDTYIKDKIESNPKIGQDVNEIKDYFIIGDEKMREKVKTAQPAPAPASTKQPDLTKPAQKPQSVTNTGDDGVTVYEKTGLTKGETAEQFIEKSNLKGHEKSNLANMMAMYGLIPEEEN